MLNNFGITYKWKESKFWVSKMVRAIIKHFAPRLGR